MAIIARDPSDPQDVARVAAAQHILDALDRDSLTPWETAFVENLEEEWIPKGRVTAKQLETLENVKERTDEFDQRRRDD